MLGEFGLVGIQVVEAQLVEPQLGHDDKAICQIGVDRVGVRVARFAAITMRDDLGGVPKAAIGKNRHGRDRATAVAGHQHTFARAIDDQMAWPIAASGDFSQRGELAAGPVDGKGKHAAVFLPFLADSIKKLLIGMDVEKRRIFGGSRQLGRGHFAGGRIEDGVIDALANRALAIGIGVGADVHVLLADRIGRQQAGKRDGPNQGGKRGAVDRFANTKLNHGWHPGLGNRRIGRLTAGTKLA